MNKYVIVSFVEMVPDGAVFAKSEWPLHVTVFHPFLSDKSEEELAERLRAAVGERDRITLVGKSEERFGANGEVAVTELANTPEMESLHSDIEKAFKPLIEVATESYDSYRPHVTHQRGKKIAVGMRIVLDSVSLVKMDKDSRQVIGTIILS